METAKERAEEIGPPAMTRGLRGDVARRELELLEANARYYRESLALVRAKLYRRGEASSARLLEFQRRLVHAERRLREYQREQSRNSAGRPPK